MRRPRPYLSGLRTGADLTNKNSGGGGGSAQNQKSARQRGHRSPRRFGERMDNQCRLVQFIISANCDLLDPAMHDINPSRIIPPQVVQDLTERLVIKADPTFQPRQRSIGIDTPHRQDGRSRHADRLAGCKNGMIARLREPRDIDGATAENHIVFVVLDLEGKSGAPDDDLTELSDDLERAIRLGPDIEICFAFEYPDTAPSFRKVERDGGSCIQGHCRAIRQWDDTLLAGGRDMVRAQPKAELRKSCEAKSKNDRRCPGGRFLREGTAPRFLPWRRKAGRFGHILRREKELRRAPHLGNLLESGRPAAVALHPSPKSARGDGIPLLSLKSDEPIQRFTGEGSVSRTLSIGGVRAAGIVLCHSDRPHLA